MKSQLSIKLSHGTRVNLTRGPDHAWAPINCPECKRLGPLKLQGIGERVAADDRSIECDGIAVCCGSFVGVVRLTVDTLFGVREDRAMEHIVAANGIKVY